MAVPETPSAKEREGHELTEEADFGQSRFGHPDLTNFGQSNFGQSIFGHRGFGPANFGQSQFWPIQFWPIQFWPIQFWPIQFWPILWPIFLVSWWGPEGWAPKGGAPKSGAPKGKGPNPEKVRAPKGGAPKGGAPKGGAPKGGAPKGKGPNPEKVRAPKLWGPEVVGPRRVGPRRVGPRRVGPRRVGPRRVGPRRVGPRRVGPRTVGAQNFALFFSLSRHSFSFFSPSLLVFFVEFWWCLKRWGAQMCTFGVLGLSCASPGGPVFAATPSVTTTRIALVMGLAHDVDMAVAEISGAFLHAAVEQPFYVKPPVDYRKPGIVWKVKKYLYGDKRAPRGWQDHFETTMWSLDFERLEFEPGCFVKKGSNAQGLDHCGGACGRSSECGKARETRQILRAVGGNVED